MEAYKLIKPIEFEGETITEIKMDLEGLTVKKLERAEREARMLLDKKESFAVPETNKKYLSCVAAKAAGVKVDLIKTLSGKDYTQICLMVQNFLLDGDSGSMEEEDEDEVTGESLKPKTTDVETTTSFAEPPRAREWPN